MKYILLIFFSLFYLVSNAQRVLGSIDSTKAAFPSAYYLNRLIIGEYSGKSAGMGCMQPPSSVFLPRLNHLPGMFCKIEYKLESKSKLAPRFRLGSLNYTEWMEGKRGLYGVQSY